jgi:hypothetical protein
MPQARPIETKNREHLCFDRRGKAETAVPGPRIKFWATILMGVLLPFLSLGTQAWSLLAASY